MERDAAIIDTYRKTASKAATAREFGISRSAVRTVLGRYQIADIVIEREASMRPLAAKIAPLWARHLPADAIAKKLGTTANTVLKEVAIARKDYPAEFPYRSRPKKLN